MGVATNTFYRYNSDYVILNRGEAHVAIIPPPSDAYVWYTSFGYEIRASAIKRIYNHIRRHLPGKWTPNERYAVRLGPLVTNSLFTTESGNNGVHREH